MFWEVASKVSGRPVVNMNKNTIVILKETISRSHQSTKRFYSRNTAMGVGSMTARVGAMIAPYIVMVVSSFSRTGFQVMTFILVDMMDPEWCGGLLNDWLDVVGNDGRLGSYKSISW